MNGRQMGVPGASRSGRWWAASWRGASSAEPGPELCHAFCGPVSRTESGVRIYSATERLAAWMHRFAGIDRASLRRSKDPLPGLRETIEALLRRVVGPELMAK